MIIEEIKGVSPVDAFLTLRRFPYPFIISGNPSIGRRYSYASAAPVKVVRTVSGVTSVTGDGRRFNDPFEALSALLKEKSAPTPPFPFFSGSMGYFSYDLNSLIEPRLKKASKDGILSIPECVAGLYDPVFVFDHAEGKGYLASISADASRIDAFREAFDAKTPKAGERVRAGRLESNTTRDEYIASVLRAKEYISSGDIYQINLSQRLSIPLSGDPFRLYLSLLEAFPAPYSSFLDYGSFQVISNSPEGLLRVSGGVAETSPIKGTRRRGADPQEDRLLVEELRRSPKERAEHVMIVDLERNDLGKISEAGSVEVSSFEKIETYPHLHHMSSTVCGRLKKGIDSPAALKAVFPGGSITGAPKLRAMEIIAELEKSARSIYTGAIGWMGFNGDCDVAMAIRTAVCLSGRMYLSVGGGIVADSDPQAEYDETMLKARDFLSVAGAREDA